MELGQKNIPKSEMDGSLNSEHLVSLVTVAFFTALASAAFWVSIFEKRFQRDNQMCTYKQALQELKEIGFSFFEKKAES